MKFFEKISGGTLIRDPRVHTGHILGFSSGYSKAQPPFLKSWRVLELFNTKFVVVIL